MSGKIYYYLKPFLPRKTQLMLRRRLVMWKQKTYKSVWPIDEKAGNSPENWTGWPEKRRFCLVLTHDVDTAAGQERCHELMRLEKHLGLRSSFNFVAERYRVLPELRRDLVSNGFEVGVHGLYHDGKLYSSRKIFQKRALKINHYLHEWQAVGFRSPSMHHNLDWIHDLNIEYDASTFDTDPFEPQPDGVGTIFPFWVSRDSDKKGYVELPYTLPQDFTLFVLMKERNIDIWKKKLDWIVRCGGMALLNTHPDYMDFGGNELGMEEYPAQYYEAFLNYIKEMYSGEFWHVLPKDIARFWASHFLEPCHSVSFQPSI